MDKLTLKPGTYTIIASCQNLKEKKPTYFTLSIQSSKEAIQNVFALPDNISKRVDLEWTKNCGGHNSTLNPQIELYIPPNPHSERSTKLFSISLLRTDGDSNDSTGFLVLKGRSL